MKRTLLAALLLSSGMAHAAFTGAFDPANWNLSPGTGVVGTFNANGLSMSSGSALPDEGFASNTDVTIALPANGTVSFDWNYTGEAITSLSGPFFDPFFALTPAAFQLTGNSPSAQSGSYSFVAQAGQTVGFRIRTIDNLGLPATVRITNFSFDDGTVRPTPEPSAAALVGLALATAAWIGRRRQRGSITAA